MLEREDPLKDKVIIGIDLGTTNSGVSVWDEQLGRVRMLPVDGGYLLLPSVVAWDQERGEWLVGHAAETLRHQRPGSAVYSIKRFMGRWFDDRCVREGRQQVAYRIVPGDRKDPLRDVMVDFGGRDAGQRTLTPSEVSARILEKLRADAALALGARVETLTHAVITVPAYFNEFQRQATLEAGRLAGFEVAHLLNEPTAAALAYRAEVLGIQERRILVFDLGGGTFDVSLLEVSCDPAGYLFNTLVVDGDTWLGGDDIDIALADWLRGEIQQLHGAIAPENHFSRERLRLAAEQAKIALSSEQDVTLELPALELGQAGWVDVRVAVPRVRLETCADRVRQSALAITRRMVEEVAALAWERVDEVILVGGQTLMPAIQRDVEGLVRRKPRVNDRPQWAVALGAGEYGHILSLGREKVHQNTLLNVIALPLGIRLDEDTFEPLVPANVTVPYTSRPYAVTTTEDNQPLVRVEVFQGPRGSERTGQCVFLGVIEMQVPPAPARTPRFEVTFEVKDDGTVDVEVIDTRSEQREKKEIIKTGVLAYRDRPHKGGN